MDSATLKAMRHLVDLEAWAARLKTGMILLSGRTLPAALAKWPLVSAPIAKALTGASRAVVRRNLAWMKANRLIRTVTGQGRFQMWHVAI